MKKLSTNPKNILIDPSEEFTDLCDTCMRSNVEVYQTDENGNTVCVDCAEERT